MKCPVCNTLVRLRSVDHPLLTSTVELQQTGLIADHRDRRFDGLGSCPASGQTIPEAKELVAGRREEAR